MNEHELKLHCLLFGCPSVIVLCVYAAHACSFNYKSDYSTVNDTHSAFYIHQLYIPPKCQKYGLTSWSDSHWMQYSQSAWWDLYLQNSEIFIFDLEFSNMKNSQVSNSIQLTFSCFCFFSLFLCFFLFFFKQIINIT